MLPYLPPGVNHQYIHLPGGKKALSRAAVEARESMAMEAVVARFRVSSRALYGVRILFVVPTWQHDIDGPIKPLLDGLFGTRSDNRIVSLEVAKVVRAQESRTVIGIREVSPTEAAGLAAGLEAGGDG